jgi:hypothetical protein
VGDDGQTPLYSGMSWSQSNQRPAHPEFIAMPGTDLSNISFNIYRGAGGGPLIWVNAMPFKACAK